MRTTSVRTSGALLVAIFVMASWVALLCEARCLVPGSLHGEPGQTLHGSASVGPVQQKHRQPVPFQVKLCILALPGAFLSALTPSSSATFAAIPAKASDGVSSDVLPHPVTFSLVTSPNSIAPKPSLLVLRI